MARKTVRFKIRNKGVEEAATGPKSRAAALDAATRMRLHAISISPHDTGTYISRFELNPHIRRDWPPGRPNPRACCDLANTDPGAIAIEKGSARTRPDGTIVTTHGFRVLQRTLEHFGALSTRIRD